MNWLSRLLYAPKVSRSFVLRSLRVLTASCLMFQKETVSAHFSDKPTNQDLAFSVGARNSERLELCLT